MRWETDNGISEKQVRYFMTIRKNQLSVILRSVLLLSMIMILLQSLDPPKLPMPMMPPPLPMHYYPIFSPVSQQANPFCSIPVCDRKAQPAHCPCHSRRGELTSNYVSAVNNDLHCQWQTKGDRGTYRFVKYDDFKKRLKRMVRRLLRVK
ncbi:hypothetical protein [Sodalis sp. dw_96]|uniref:hypothetical protein n=1 Tax=Sodalis sp. dw_96 TaxID=2719794 RepID=UPI001BD65D88|nr:hypothetical protein [Sodalis sp. dw_96]